jgi:hypothetical protein
MFRRRTFLSGFVNHDVNLEENGAYKVCEKVLRYMVIITLTWLICLSISCVICGPTFLSAQLCDAAVSTTLLMVCAWTYSSVSLCLLARYQVIYSVTSDVRSVTESWWGLCSATKAALLVLWTFHIAAAWIQITFVVLFGVSQYET